MVKDKKKLARFSMLHATVGKHSYLEDFFPLVAQNDIPYVSPSMDNVRALGPMRTRKALKDNGLKLLGTGGGGWFNLGPEQERIDVSKRAIDTANATGAKWLLMITGGMLEGKTGLEDARERTRRSIDILLDYAKGSDLQLAIEPLHPMLAADRSWLVSLKDAAQFAGQLDPNNDRELGIVADAYHLWWDPYLEEAIKLAVGRILSVHLCDWRVPTRSLRNDRAMTGEGAIDIGAFCQKFENAGFTSHYETEVLSDDWWERDPAEVIGIAKQAYLDNFKG